MEDSRDNRQNAAVDELDAKTSNMTVNDVPSKPPTDARADAPSNMEADSRFEALVRDRDSLREEVAELRKSLEQIQSKHDEDMGTLQKKLEDTQSEKEHSDSQFRNLMGKVNTIKAQLGERLKADAVCFGVHEG